MMAQSAGRNARRSLLAAVALTLALMIPGAPVYAKPGALSATPTFVNLGPIPSGTEGETAIEVTNNTSLTFTILDVDFVTVNSFGLAQSACTGNVPFGPGQTCSMTVFMGPVHVGPAAMRLRWRSGSASSNWVLIVATGT
jgi:hypothetical protein